MARGIHFKRSEPVDNTGLSSSIGGHKSRFVNQDGTYNVKRKGAGIFNRYSVYHFLINLSALKFSFLIFGFYTFINFLFACIYYFFCIDHLLGIVVGTPLETFEEAYFFSSQTLTTVGYGRISPVGIVTNTVASLEALIGILTLAIITGLLYGRFVKPKAYIRFSKQALISPFKDGKALMFRLMPIKNARLSDVLVHVTLGLMVGENSQKKLQYFVLPLQFNTINSLILNWTVVHPIDEKSPLWGLEMEDLIQADFELMIYLKAFDEDFSNTVIARTGYTSKELIPNAKFDSMFYEDDANLTTVVDLSKLSDYTKL